MDGGKWPNLDFRFVLFIVKKENWLEEAAQQRERRLPSRLMVYLVMVRSGQENKREPDESIVSLSLR